MSWQILGVTEAPLKAFQDLTVLGGALKPGIYSNVSNDTLSLTLVQYDHSNGILLTS